MNEASKVIQLAKDFIELICGICTSYDLPEFKDEIDRLLVNADNVIGEIDPSWLDCPDDDDTWRKGD